MGDTDFKPLLTDLAADSPEALYFPIFVAEGGLITQQARETNGLEDYRLKGRTACSPRTGSRPRGRRTPRSLHLGSGPDGVRQSGVLRERVLPAYEDKFGEEPQSVFHAHSFDAMMMITAAIEEAVIQEGGTTFIPGPR